MMKERGISYQAALQTVRGIHESSSAAVPTADATRAGQGMPLSDEFVGRLIDRAAGETVSTETKNADSEEAYRAALTALTERVEAWQRSCEDDEDDDRGNGRLLDEAYTMARQIIRELRDNSHKFRVKLDIVEVAYNTLQRFAAAVENHEELSIAYESSYNHSVYEADEELERDLRLAKRFLAEADKPEYRQRYTYEENPLRQLEAVPVPVPDPDGETVDGIQQGTRLRSTHDADEIRTLLTGPYKDRTFGMAVRLSDPRDGVVPQPGENSVFAGYVVLADQLRMLFEPITE
jgi:hypothetical protein